MSEVFTWCPSVEPQGTINYRTLIARFGDGYQQTMGDGINNRIQSWPLEFTGKEETIKPILTFLDKHAGFRSFLWTPPLGEQGYYKAVQPQLTALGAGNYTLSVTFEQIFKP